MSAATRSRAAREVPLVSLVVPCYNEEEALPFLYAEIAKVPETIRDASFEFVFVDDGSSDRTLEILMSLAEWDGRIRYVSFSRNFGKEAALLAGLREAKGAYVAVLDADLQDPPALLPEMFAAVTSGEFDCAATRRVTRKGEPPIRTLFARLFYRIMARISDAGVVDGARDFRLMNRRMVDSILSLGEYNRFSKGIFSWVGFRTKWVEYENVERVAGKTKWSFWGLFLYSLEGIIAFSTAPLVIASVMGIVLFVSALALAGALVVKTVLWGDPVAGYPSLMCVILFIGGVQLFTIGILGQYLSKTYLETKRRPSYIVRESSAAIGAKSLAAD